MRGTAGVAIRPAAEIFLTHFFFLVQDARSLLRPEHEKRGNNNQTDTDIYHERIFEKAERKNKIKQEPGEQCKKVQRVRMRQDAVYVPALWTRIYNTWRCFRHYHYYTTKLAEPHPTLSLLRRGCAPTPPQSYTFRDSRVCNFSDNLKAVPWLSIPRYDALLSSFGFSFIFFSILLLVPETLVTDIPHIWILISAAENLDFPQIRLLSFLF